MSKTNEQLFIDYKKSNKERRQKIVSKAGFSTEAEYLSSLLSDTHVGSPAAAALFKHNKKEAEVDADMLDQVIAFDTTGSMSSYLSAVKEHVKELIPKLFAQNPSLRVKIVAFGDYCDMESATSFGKAYQACELTNDQNALINFVNTAKSTAGGDVPEFYELVIKKVVEETAWRPGSKRAMLLIADHGPHEVGYSYNNIVKNAQIDWKQEAGKAVGIGLQIDTLSCGTAAVETFYKPLSFMTDGVNLPFSSSHKTQDAIYAATSVRGSEMSRMAFMAESKSSATLADAELTATYSALSKKLL